MAAARMRRDVWKLDEWDPILLWYAKAVAGIRGRPLNAPTSWRYQAAIHAYERQRGRYKSDAGVTAVILTERNTPRPRSSVVRLIAALTLTYSMDRIFEPAADKIPSRPRNQGS